MGTWADVAREFETSLRLRTFPLAIRFTTKEQAENLPRVVRMGHNCMFCQVVAIARTTGRTVAVHRGEVEGACTQLLGFQKISQERANRRVGVWLETKEAAEKFWQDFQPLGVPCGTHDVVLVGPLASEKFEPDVILLHGTPAQMHLLLCAYMYKNYERFRFYFTGESACVDSLAEAYVSRKPALCLPCYGQRRYGHVREDELELALPPEKAREGLDGLKWLSQRGFRYPIPHWGTETDPFPGAAASYGAHMTKPQQG